MSRDKPELVVLQATLVVILFGLCLIITGYIGARDLDHQVILCFCGCQWIMVLVLFISALHAVHYMMIAEHAADSCALLTDEELAQEPTCAGTPAICKDLSGAMLEDRAHECANEREYARWQARRLWIFIPQTLLCGAAAYHGHVMVKVIKARYAAHYQFYEDLFGP